jgi:hypothetical protein
MAEASMVAGTGLSMYGSIMQGNANGNIADYNATVANQNADIAIAQGEEMARRSRLQTTKLIGAQSAAYGAAGVTSDGSAMDVMRASAQQGELNALTLKNNAAIKANAYRNEANLDRFRAGNDRTAGYINAASSLLGGGSKLMGMSGGGGGGNIPTDGEE